MTRRTLTLLLWLVAGILLRPSEAAAQFETPNRAFHNTTAFRLDGKHQAVACESCHLNGQYKGTPTSCYDCHWIRRRDDRYQTRLGSQCEQCHRPTSWTAVQWNHGAQAGVQLNADHRTIACESCHRGGVFRSASVTCVGCHQKEYSATRAPNHAAAGFPTVCESCHRPSDTTWQNTGTGGFSHNSVFALVGTHATATCTACHRNNIYKGTARDCFGCHRNEYNGAQNPNHLAAGFPQACDACHKATDPSFRGSGAATSFSHNSVFELTGVHGTIACNACHKNNVFGGTPRECVGCHQNDYSRAQNPNHVAGGFSTACETCHRPSDPTFAAAGAFNHGAIFSLVGRHAAQSCAVCHRNNVFKGTARDCIGCHQAEYAGTRTPNHAAAGFSTSCDSCHRASDSQWAGAGGFNHNAVFSLVGVHATQSCAVCHKNNVYKGTPRDCVGCHQSEYAATRNPPHQAAGFPTSCDQCHRPTDAQWTGASFNHNNVFALVGVHASQACSACHVNNVYRGTPRDCVGCHRTEYNNTKNPPHQAAGFPTSCDQCHRPTDARWTGANFNHNSFFSLVGVHASQACSACHANNVYKGTPRDCVGCHRTEYNNTRNPNHSAVGFNTVCDTCHKATDTSWNQGKFNHTAFPLTGRHNVACAQCHTTPNNYKAFSCTVCHTRSETDAQHRNRRNYVYDSNACYSCHPNGRGD